MEDVGNWDSLTHMDLIASLEETFSIQLSMDEIMEMRDIKTIKRIISEKVV
jgi:acyl carrier protein